MGTARSTHELTTSTQVKVGYGLLTSIQIATDGTNDATVIAYDVAASGSAAAGNKIFEFTVAGAHNYGGRDWSVPVRFTNGLYITVSGTGASFIAEWTR